MRIIDCVTINGEHELFEIRYNVLKPFVDEFRVVEFDKTFSGKPKKSTFNQYFPKVKHYIHNEDVWGKYHDLALSSPNTEFGKGAQHWVTEFCQKESIKECLTDLKDDDMVFLGDVDELWNPNLVYADLPKKLKLHVYSYFLNNKSTEQFWGTTVAHYRDIKNECLNHLRTHAPKTELEWGWHFTSMGGYENVKKKLTDSYTEETWATPMVMAYLEESVTQNIDLFNRGFEYTTDESWPEYLKQNKEKYKHLIK